MTGRGISIGMGLVSTLLLVPSAAHADAQTYRELCSKCHARATTIARSIKGGTSAEKSEWLGTFLTSHHAGDPAQRAKLVSYLVGLTGK